MNKSAFTAHYIENISIGLFLFVASFVVVLLILRRHIYSIFDPLFFMAIMSSAAYSVVFYLYYFGFISDYYFSSFLITQLAFFVGFLMNRGVSKRDYPPHSVNDGYARFYGPIYFLYPISVLLYFLSQGFVYYNSGIPLLMDSGLEIFSGGSGYGFLSRIIYVTSIISVSLSFFRMIYIKNSFHIKLCDFFVFSIAISFAVLSGSKAALLLMIFICFYVLFYSRKFGLGARVEAHSKRLFQIVLAVSIPTALITIYVQTGYDSIFEVFASLLMRFINTGDIFYMSYPDGVLGELIPANPFIALFKDFLGISRLVSWENLPVNLGLQVFWFHYNTDLVTGPNARHNIFGLFYFGFYPSIIFSFLLGFLTSFMRNGLYRFLPRNLSGMMIYILFAYTALFIEQDPSGLAMGYFISIFLIFPVLYFTSILFSFFSSRAAKRFLV